MEQLSYPVPSGLSAIPKEFLDLRPDAEVDQQIMTPEPIRDEKNVFFFWHSGYENMHNYTKRNVRAWHRRFSKKGWVIHVVDLQPGSSFNIANYVDVNDPANFPKAFSDGAIEGPYGPQHTSDLVRWPLLLKYGGFYADVGMMPIGDIDRLWNTTIGDPKSGFEVVSYNLGGLQGRNLANYFLGSNKNNVLFQRCHRLFLELWAADGGKSCTDGMHLNPLVTNIPPQDGGGNSLAFEHDGRSYTHEEGCKILTDYVIQAQAMSLVMGLIDEEENWNGPKYVAERVFAMEYAEGSQLMNLLTMWNGPRQFELMSLPLPKEGEEETEDQKEARNIVEQCLQKSFCVKLAHGLIIKVLGQTLGSLWRDHTDSDDVPWTYGHWLRHGMVHWEQPHLMPRLEFEVIEPFKRGPLLRVA